MCVYVYTQKAYIYINTYMHTYIHTYTHMHTHAYIHTYIMFLPWRISDITLGAAV